MTKLAETGINNSDSISSIANFSPAYVFDYESLSNTVKTMLMSGHRRIPIVSKNNDLVGIVTYMDILDALLRGVSRNAQISNFMTHEIILAEPNESISTVLKKFHITKRGGMPLVKNQKLVGIVSERDFIKSLTPKYFGMTVNEIMTHKPFFVQSGSSIRNCMKSMVNSHYRRLPVLKNKDVIGIVTGLDILHFINDTNYNPVKIEESVDSIMSTPVKYLTEDHDVSDAVQLMTEYKIGGLPVINEENSLKGIITERDIVEML